ncbi:MAG: D-2-hydroxyacid dehydrogenase [Acidobacteria bacterium]|nr:D-2-hydroxyacid dehydrogenase [Acidobacteriota bacterium]
MPIKLLSIIYHPFSLWHAPEWLRPRLQRDFPQLEVTVRDDFKTIEDDIREAEIFLGWSLRGEQLKAARQLRWIHSTAAAVHTLMSPELAASDILVTNARTVHGPVVAEHAIALILAMAKRLPSSIRYQQQRQWAQDEIWAERPEEVSGATLLVIGLGSIGGGVAEKARKLGMHVLAVREHPERGPGAAHEVFGSAGLRTALPRADFVVLAAPVTPRTNRFFTAAELGWMKPRAFFINISRGSLVDEPALIAALRNRRIAGAALDVFDEEPLPEQSELWELPNVLITPHTAGVTERMWDRQYELLAENLQRYIARQPLLNPVDTKAGY